MNYNDRPLFIKLGAAVGVILNIIVIIIITHLPAIAMILCVIGIVIESRDFSFYKRRSRKLV